MQRFWGSFFAPGDTLEQQQEEEEEEPGLERQPSAKSKNVSLPMEEAQGPRPLDPNARGSEGSPRPRDSNDDDVDARGRDGWGGRGRARRDKRSAGEHGETIHGSELAARRRLDSRRSFVNMTSTTVWDRLSHAMIFGASREENLNRVLYAADSLLDSGYCQGMNYLGAILVLACHDDGEAFAVLMWVLRDRGLEALYVQSGVGLQSLCKSFDEHFTCAEPELYDHFRNNGLETSFFTVEWFPTLFAKSVQPALMHFVLDAFLVLSEHFVDSTILFHLATAVFLTVKSELLVLEDEDLLRGSRDIVRAAPMERVMETFVLLLAEDFRDKGERILKGSHSISTFPSLQDIKASLVEEEQDLQVQDDGTGTTNNNTGAWMQEEERKHIDRGGVEPDTDSSRTTTASASATVTETIDSAPS